MANSIERMLASFDGIHPLSLLCKGEGGIEHGNALLGCENQSNLIHGNNKTVTGRRIRRDFEHAFVPIPSEERITIAADNRYNDLICWIGLLTEQREKIFIARILRKGIRILLIA